MKCLGVKAAIVCLNSALSIQGTKGTLNVNDDEVKLELNQVLSPRDGIGMIWMITWVSFWADQNITVKTSIFSMHIVPVNHQIRFQECPQSGLSY